MDSVTNDPTRKPRLLDYVTEADLDRFVEVLAVALLAEAREQAARKAAAATPTE